MADAKVQRARTETASNAVELLCLRPDPKKGALRIRIGFWGATIL